jgi:aspartate aminotransferase, mitochondrial
MFSLARTLATRRVSMRAYWSGVEEGRPDPILGLTVAYRKDANESKVNLGVGAYRTDEGKPLVLECVKAAKAKLLSDANLDHEYAGITGIDDFVRRSVALAFGSDSVAIHEERVAATQTLSGTGALRVAAAFLSRFRGPKTPVYMPTPTWANHMPTFGDAELRVQPKYRYYDAATCGLDFDGMLGDLHVAPKGAVVLLHACAHNPTGVDPSAEQWAEISAVMKERGLFALFDCAYQGFATGDPEVDAGAIRRFVDDGHNVAVCQSYSKNFGLYGERTGCLSLLAADTAERDRLLSQLKILIRPMYSNPPIFGARIVATILGDEQLTALWRTEVQAMADRINIMRSSLVDALARLGSTRDWSHIVRQKGMFCFTGLAAEQCDHLIAEHSVYLTRNGRISIAGVTSQNVQYVAEAIHNVTKD